MYGLHVHRDSDRTLESSPLSQNVLGERIGNLWKNINASEILAHGHNYELQSGLYLHEDQWYKCAAKTYSLKQGRKDLAFYNPHVGNDWRSTSLDLNEAGTNITNMLKSILQVYLPKADSHLCINSNTVSRLISMIGMWTDLSVKAMRHENVACPYSVMGLVPLWDVKVVEENSLLVIMPLYPRGCVMNASGGVVNNRPVLRACGEYGTYRMDFVKLVAKSLDQSIKNLHDSGYYHRDIKPQNVFFVGDSGYEVVLGDFDGLLPVTFHSGWSLDWNGGTRSFSTPVEGLCEKSKITPGWDYWGFGCTLYALMYNVPPFWGTNENDIHSEIRGNLKIPTMHQLREVWTYLGRPSVCACGRFDDAICCSNDAACNCSCSQHTHELKELIMTYTNTVPEVRMIHQV